MLLLRRCRVRPLCCCLHDNSCCATAAADACVLPSRAEGAFSHGERRQKMKMHAGETDQEQSNNTTTCSTTDPCWAALFQHRRIIGKRWGGIISSTRINGVSTTAVLYYYCTSTKTDSIHTNVLLRIILARVPDIVCICHAYVVQSVPPLTALSVLRGGASKACTAVQYVLRFDDCGH